MSQRRWNSNALVLWSAPLLLVLLMVSLATPHSHPKHHRTTTTISINTNSGAVGTTASIAGQLSITNPQLMVPVPHAGRWYLQSSNSLSAELVCQRFRLSIDQVFVEPANEQCQVVLVALHLPTPTIWRLDSA
jgi:hypothetical protein